MPYTIRRWNTDDIAKLKSMAQRQPVAAIAAQLGRSTGATVVMAHKLKLSLRVRPEKRGWFPSRARPRNEVAGLKVSVQLGQAGDRGRHGARASSLCAAADRPDACSELAVTRSGGAHAPPDFRFALTSLILRISMPSSSWRGFQRMPAGS
jgi:hypothetical protein